MENPFIYFFLGMFAYFFMDLSTFRKSLQDEFLSKVIKQYFNLNLFSIVAGLLIGFAIVLLMISNTMPEFISDFLKGIGLDMKEVPGSALLVGFLNQWIPIKVRKFTNSVIAKTEDNTVVTSQSEETGTHPKFPSDIDKF